MLSSALTGDFLLFISALLIIINLYIRLRQWVWIMNHLNKYKSAKIKKSIHHTGKWSRISNSFNNSPTPVTWSNLFSGDTFSINNSDPISADSSIFIGLSLWNWCATLKAFTTYSWCKRRGSLRKWKTRTIETNL